MYCRNCGTKSNDSQKFCTSCGNAFASANMTEPKHETHDFSKNHKKSSWDAGRIIAIAVLVGLVSIGAYNSRDEDVIDKNNAALVSLNSGNRDQAITGFQEASTEAVTTENKITTLKNLAYSYAGSSSLENKNLAIETFKKALALTTQDSFDYYLIAGEIALLENKPNSAIVAYNKAYEKNPDNFQINNALTLFYLDIEDNAPQYVDYSKAVKYAEKTAQLSDLPLTKENLGLAYYFNENYDKAISTFLGVTSPMKPAVAYFLGLSYAAVKNPIQAKFYLNKAIDGGQSVSQEITDYINTH